MLVRFGRVLYWAFCFFAVLVLGGTVAFIALAAVHPTFNVRTDEAALVAAIALVGAVALYLFGRGCRYVLSAE